MKRLWVVSLVLIVALLVVGCAVGGSDGVERVYIRSGGEIQSTYELGSDGEVLQSTTTDYAGGRVTRAYSYGPDKALASVTRVDGRSRAATTYLTGESDRSLGDRPTRTVKRVVGSDGVAAEYELEYFYAEDGTLEGVMQTDAWGNVQARSVED